MSHISGSSNLLCALKDVTLAHSHRKAWRGGSERLSILTS